MAGAAGPLTEGTTSPPGGAADPEDLAAGGDLEAPCTERLPGAAAVGDRRRRLLLSACVASYLALGVLANLPVWLTGPSRAVQSGGAGDIGQEIWFLGWVPGALGRGLDPLVSTFVNFPWGVTLMGNTAMPVAGLLGAPITLAFGPIVTFDVLFSLAFASSATAAFFVFRRFVSWMPAAYAGGLLYGFSPFMVAEGDGHLFLLFEAAFPVLLLLADEVLVRQRHRPWSAGALLGLVAALQLGLSAELLAWAAVVGLVGLLVLAGANARAVRPRLGHALRAGAVALAVFAALAAFPVSTLLTGPDHPGSTIHPTQGLSGLSTDLASLVIPTSNQRVQVGLAASGDRLVTLAPRGVPPQPDPAEDGSYLGTPLLMLLAAGALRYRRDRRLRFALVMALVALVLSLGGHLRADGHDLGVPLPFLALEHLPFLDSGIASRFAPFLWLPVALALALVLDHVRKEPFTTRPGVAWASAGVAAGLLGAAAVSLLPAWPYQISAASVPAWFTSAEEGAVPSGSVLLTYPLARQTHNQGMLWQALDGFRYRIPAGEAAVADTYYSPLERVFDSCYAGTANLPLDAVLVRQVRLDLSERKVATVVVPESEPGASCAVRYLQGVLGTRPRNEDGAEVWSGLSWAGRGAPATAARGG